MAMNKIEVDRLFGKYPKLPNFICAGTISLKAARTILDVDRWLMYDIFVKLIEHGAVNAAGPSMWRATSELKDYVEEWQKSVNS